MKGRRATALLTLGLVGLAACAGPSTVPPAQSVEPEQIAVAQSSLEDENTALRQDLEEANTRIDELLKHAYDMQAVGSCYMFESIRETGIKNRLAGRLLSSVERGALMDMSDAFAAVQDKSIQAATSTLADENRKLLAECLDRAHYRPYWARDRQSAGAD